MTTYENGQAESTYSFNRKSRTITVVLEDGFWNDSKIADGRTVTEANTDGVCEFVRQAIGEIRRAVLEIRP